MKNIRAFLQLLLVLLAGGFVPVDCLSAQPPALAKNPEKKFVAYRITRGDRLSISVVGEPDLTVGQRRVEATGTINMLLINDIRVVGLTIAEAQEAIATAYRDGRFLRNPQVTVTVDEYAPRIVRISGKVNSPGQIHIPPDTEMTIIELIFKANGLAETARASAIRVTRTMPDGTEKLFTLDVEAAIKARGKSTGDGSFVVQPDDVVYVQEKII
ncbi:MAG: polysaccharide biosynthesis/export family protein [Opitutaceae bacterium]|nr:polysaccharide biosynthesis/export family protein [Opitutaceae bacterium]